MNSSLEFPRTQAQQFKSTPLYHITTCPVHKIYFSPPEFPQGGLTETLVFLVLILLYNVVVSHKKASGCGVIGLMPPPYFILLALSHIF